MKKAVILVVLGWMMLVGTSFVWNIANDHQSHHLIAHQTARSLFKFIVLTREWNARHGGVYVPVTRQTRPNPYLNDASRDIRVSPDLLLTKINPSFMTRQLSELAEQYEGISFRITSLNPLRPANRAIPLEKKVLKAFDGGKEEVGKLIERNGEEFFFYMAPLKTRKVCLPCHADQGYQVGDIRGGISIILPFDFHSHYQIMVTHLLIGLAGLLGVWFSSHRLKQAYETIKRQAETDTLTGLYNRRIFADKINVEIERCQRDQVPLSVLMGDIDRFKEYNDSFGHAEGDACLKKVAQTIQSNLKRPGDFCVRYGGEEFVAVLPGTGRNGARQVAERIRKEVEQLGQPQEGEECQTATISFGVATLPENSEMSHEKLMEQTDQALYRAKREGRNRVEVFAGGE